MHQKPLAELLRPKSMNDILGQQKTLAKGLKKLVEEDRFHSLLFWGPPGTGKTSLAYAISNQTNRKIFFLSAVEAGVKDIRACFKESQSLIDSGEKSAIVFIDEIHRLSKSQQDVLLKAIEQGQIKFIGATTENPSFEVNNAILSRCLTFKLNSLNHEAILELIHKAIKHLKAQGLNVDMNEDVIRTLCQYSAGDGRKVINLVEALCYGHPNQKIDMEVLREFLPDQLSRYDKKQDDHYDTISAFIKCIRASDPDGAVLYLAKMLHGGEDPRFIARRLIISASEDIGNASPTALLIATAALEACKNIGMPEARIILGQATTFLASCPKSNRSYLAINKAMETAKRQAPIDIPMHLRNAPTKFMKESGYGDGYVYAHNNQKKAARINNLPKNIQNQTFYEPSESGTEKSLKAYLDYLRKN